MGPLAAVGRAAGATAACVVGGGWRAAMRGDDENGRAVAALMSWATASASSGVVESDDPRSSNCRRLARVVVRCARKPVRLSNNKKKAKLRSIQREGRRGKSGGGKGGEASSSSSFESAGGGGLSPQQRVKAAKHEARRWLGQHFLIDHGVILDAVEAAAIAPGDRILEIGPGTGNLTVEMLRAGATITAVEKDRSLADKLVETFEGEPGLEVTQADFLKWNVVEAFRDVTEAVAAAGGAGGAGADARAKVVANIPYNITTDILKTLLPMGDTFSNMVFMFQEEVAQRLIRDDAGSSDYRPMSVRVHYYSEPYYIRPVTAACFDPPPNVESCLVGFRPKPSAELLPLAGTDKQFFTFVQACFAQKRKMLKNNLKAVCDGETIDAGFEMLGRHEKTRAQELSMQEYVKLFNFVRARGQGQQGRRVPAAPTGDADGASDGEKSTPAPRRAKKESAREREEKAKISRMTSRLVAQAVGRDAREDAKADADVESL